MLDVLGKLIIELRQDPAVAAITERIRGFEPAPGDAATVANSSPVRYKNAFVVLVTLATPRMKGVPVQRPRIAARCYGRTPQEAAALYGACSDAIHHVGPRVHANGLGVYNSHDDTGGTAERDPDTGQPLVSFVIDLHATTQVVA
jgi:hypothetical protein